MEQSSTHHEVTHEPTARLQEMKNATGKIPRLRLGMTHSVISNECERSFFSSIFEGAAKETKSGSTKK